MKYKLVDGKYLDEDGNEIEIEIEQEQPAPVQEQDNAADVLTSSELDKKIEKLVDEKITLAQTALDDEEEHLEEDDEEEEEKSLGLFPLLVIGGIAAVGVTAFFLNNRPISHPTQSEE